MSANSTDTSLTPASEAANLAPTATQQESSPGVPKKFAPGQTVCNERNEKNKLCNGHLKQVHTGGEEAAEHLRGDDALFKCQSCGTLYMGPPLGHVRDPYKQQRFVEKELTAILQAAGGTLPAFKLSERGTWVPAEEAPAHAPAAATAESAATKTAAKPAPTATKPAAGAESPEEKRARLESEIAARKAAASTGKPATTADVKSGAQAAASTASHTTLPPLANMGPVPGETHEQKIERLKALVAAAKARQEAMEAVGEGLSAPASTPAAQTTPAAASTSGTDSSASADAHRPAAEAQAATGMASAAPLSPAAATASPVAGPETATDLAPDALTETTSDMPKASAKPQQAQGQGKRASFDTGPVPGETHEQKIARLRSVVAAAKERAGE